MNTFTLIIIWSCDIINFQTFNQILRYTIIMLLDLLEFLTISTYYDFTLTELQAKTILGTRVHKKQMNHYYPYL